MTSCGRFFLSAPRIRVLVLAAACLLGLTIYNVPASGQIDVWVDPGHCCKVSGAVGFNGPAFPNVSAVDSKPASGGHFITGHV